MFFPHFLTRKKSNQPCFFSGVTNMYLYFISIWNRMTYKWLNCVDWILFTWRPTQSLKLVKLVNFQHYIFSQRCHLQNITKFCSFAFAIVHSSKEKKKLFSSGKWRTENLHTHILYPNNHAFMPFQAMRCHTSWTLLNSNSNLLLRQGLH